MTQQKNEGNSYINDRFKYYEEIKSSIIRWIYIHRIIEDWISKDDRAHDFTVKLISKLHLLDNKKQKEWANPDNLLANWCITNVKWWQNTLKKDYFKYIHTQPEIWYEIELESYSDFKTHDEIDQIVEFQVFEKLQDIKLIIEKLDIFDDEQKIIYNLHYIQDIKLQDIADKLWKNYFYISNKHKDLIKKLQIYKEFI